MSLSTILRQLTKTELDQMRGGSKKAPLLIPTSESTRHLTCPMCLDFKPSEIVLHIYCFKIFCASCAAFRIESGSDQCPNCRQPTTNSNPLMPTNYCKPPPIVQLFIDDAKFECKSCHHVMTRFEANEHPNKCQSVVPRPSQPDFVPPRREGPVVRHEIVSNPPEYEHWIPPKEKDFRLIVTYLNGQKFDSRDFPKNCLVTKYRAKFAKKLDVQPESLRIFKFSHQELKEYDSLKDFTHSQGATFLSVYTTPFEEPDFPSLPGKTAHLIFEEIGQRPVIPPPPPSPEPEWPEVIENIEDEWLVEEVLAAAEFGDQPQRWD